MTKALQKHRARARRFKNRDPSVLGNPAALALLRGRPVALRPRLSTGLPSTKRRHRTDRPGSQRNQLYQFDLAKIAKKLNPPLVRDELTEFPQVKRQNKHGRSNLSNEIQPLIEALYASATESPDQEVVTAP